jgi:8-oxo-dGTP pyrophosphatase MutT (NUDIX family)
MSEGAEQPSQQDKPKDDMEMDEAVTPTGCGVLVVKDGKILVGNRKDNGLLCGPGGHIEEGEKAEEAAIRETREEFGINIAETIPITVISGMPDEYCPTQVYLCTEFYGNPLAFNDEMENARFESVSEIMEQEMFLPFELSIIALLHHLNKINTDDYDDENGGWATIRGNHCYFKNGMMMYGNPMVLGQDIGYGGGGGSSSNGGSTKSEKEKKGLKESESSGTMYVEEQIHRYAENPKELGETTHKEKYDDFKEKGADVRPLTQSKTLKNVPYEDGGGYKVNDGKDGIFSYHPAKGSRHSGEYYKVSTGKTGTKRYTMEGELKKD